MWGYSSKVKLVSTTFFLRIFPVCERTATWEGTQSRTRPSDVLRVAKTRNGAARWPGVAIIHYFTAREPMNLFGWKTTEEGRSNRYPSMPSARNGTLKMDRSLGCSLYTSDHTTFVVKSRVLVPLEVETTDIERPDNSIFSNYSFSPWRYPLVLVRPQNHWYIFSKAVTHRKSRRNAQITTVVGLG